MTNEQPVEAMSEAEVTAFSAELEAWAATRSPKEQVFLRNVLVLASHAEPEDVQGYYGGSTIQGIGQLVTAIAPVVGLLPGVGPVVAAAAPLVTGVGASLAGADSTAKQLNPKGAR